MSSTSDNDNAKTVQAYNHNLQAYIDDQPAEPSPELQEFFKSMLAKTPKSGKILELGAGTGRDAHWIQHLGYKVDATDASMACVSYMREHRLSAKFLDVLSDNYPGGYDLIFASALLVHFNDSETKHILGKCHESLTDRGLLAIRTKEGDKAEWTTEKMGSPRFMRYWDKSELETALKHAGFNILSSYSTSASIDRLGRAWLYIVARKA